MIRFGTYNIRNSLNGSLDYYLQGMDRANIELGFFQENKLTEGVYAQESEGYKVVASDATSQHRGGMAIFYRESPHFTVEAHHNHGPNVIIFQLVTGTWICFIVGCYLSPDDATSIKHTVGATEQRP